MTDLMLHDLGDYATIVKNTDNLRGIRQQVEQPEHRFRMLFFVCPEFAGIGHNLDPGPATGG